MRLYKFIGIFTSLLLVMFSQSSYANFIYNINVSSDTLNGSGFVELANQSCNPLIENCNESIIDFSLSLLATSITPRPDPNAPDYVWDIPSIFNKSHLNAAENSWNIGAFGELLAISLSGELLNQIQVGTQLIFDDNGQPIGSVPVYQTVTMHSLNLSVDSAVLDCERVTGGGSNHCSHPIPDLSFTTFDGEATFSAVSVAVPQPPVLSLFMVAIVALIYRNRKLI
ncbi:hypothetical protein [Colwellia sp. MEBiC06753]